MTSAPLATGRSYSPGRSQGEVRAATAGLVKLLGCARMKVTSENLQGQRDVGDGPVDQHVRVRLPGPCHRGLPRADVGVPGRARPRSARRRPR